jgi:hypothetical protein
MNDDDRNDYEERLDSAIYEALAEQPRPWWWRWSAAAGLTVSAKRGTWRTGRAGPATRRTSAGMRAPTPP